MRPRLFRRPAPASPGRLGPDALRALERAHDEALALRHGSLGTEHLLLALAAEPESAAGRLLARLGVAAAVVRAAAGRVGDGPRPALDREALATLGIDLDEVRRRVEESFGPGALERAHARTRGLARRACGPGASPVSPLLKRALATAACEAAARGHDHAGGEHLLAGICAVVGSGAARILRELGVDPQLARGAALAAADASG
jgi:ATP-dependent Clp protease ATP-binding subunit ClpA